MQTHLKISLLYKVPSLVLWWRELIKRLMSCSRLFEHADVAYGHLISDKGNGFFATSISKEDQQGRSVMKIINTEQQKGSASVQWRISDHSEPLGRFPSLFFWLSFLTFTLLCLELISSILFFLSSTFIFKPQSIKIRGECPPNHRRNSNEPIMHTFLLKSRITQCGLRHFKLNGVTESTFDQPKTHSSITEHFTVFFSSYHTLVLYHLLPLIFHEPRHSLLVRKFRWRKLGGKSDFWELLPLRRHNTAPAYSNSTPARLRYCPCSPASDYL